MIHLEFRHEIIQDLTRQLQMLHSLPMSEQDYRDWMRHHIIYRHGKTEILYVMYYIEEGKNAS